MSPRGALHRRETRERQKISEGVHADVGVEQHVELLFRYDIARRRQMVREIYPAIRVRLDKPPYFVVLPMRKPVHRHVKMFAGQLRDDPLEHRANRVVVEILRDDAERNLIASLEATGFTAMRRDVRQRWAGTLVECSEFLLQPAVVTAVVNKIKVGLQSLLDRVFD